MIGNEAFYMLQEGIASRRRHRQGLKLGLNHPMGPFELVDLVGLDTRLHILEYLHKTLGEKFRPAPLLVQYVKAGTLGRKSGRGVYDYPDSKPRIFLRRQRSVPAATANPRKNCRNSSKPTESIKAGDLTSSELPRLHSRTTQHRGASPESASEPRYHRMQMTV